MVHNIIEALNDEQKKAVLQTDGPVLILAGAGSGKTRVIVHKIAYLISQAYATPSQILALTFTNKAAQEMKSRIVGIVGGLDFNFWIGTFHSLFARILRIELPGIGGNGNFTIYDESDQKKIVTGILHKKNLEGKGVLTNYCLKYISLFKNRILVPKDARMSASTPEEKLVVEIYAFYENELKNNNAMDFDDLLFKTYLLFQRFPEIRGKYARRFKYILVDE
ncbi:MAG: UvrD-helicase domain-containing protein, partial [Elusimicrobiota bacterium]